MVEDEEGEGNGDIWGWVEYMGGWVDGVGCVCGGEYLSGFAACGLYVIAICVGRFNRTQRQHRCRPHARRRQATSTHAN